MPDAEIPPRSAARRCSAPGPPDCSLAGARPGSAGSLRPPAALMSGEEEPEAEGRGRSHLTSGETKARGPSARQS